MKRMRKMLAGLVRGEDGATMVEYGLMVALIAALCIGVVTTLGQNVNTKFNSVKTAVG